MNTIEKDNSVIIIIDIQDKLSKMLNDDSVIQNSIKISKTANTLNIPVIITEQYPQGLGETIDEIKASIPNAKYIEKTNFSAYKESDFRTALSNLHKKQAVILGIETHICVLQTAFDLLNNGYEIFIVQDSSGSRNDCNNQAALKRLIHAGCQIVTTEMVIFELLKSSKHPNFKEIQALIK